MRFNAARPLRVLFLGQVNLRKGVGALLDAVRVLKDAPVEFLFIGPSQITPPKDLVSDPRVVWHGPAARSDVHLHYRNADILVFPTLSDGFGLTQLEARAWRLPIIVTRRCGAVIEDGVTGIVVEPGDPKAIAEAIQHCIDAPAWLQSAADAIAPGERHDIDRLGKSLAAIA
jgi:glycosyltransferase involved in cell wall biosynthesis